MKRTLLTIAVAIALVALFAGTAFAEGYNSEQGLLDPNGGEGIYVRDAGAGQIQSFTGPHGGYTTTTNKCQDCHSTHYAYGSYKLLRANEAAAACDYCHGGGGGSEINIMMDNEYRTGEFDVLGNDTLHNGDAGEDMSPSAVTTTTGGFGTGHTLGYQGNAPADIQPAFTAGTDGLACFDCHTPHGNSARVLEAFGSPSHPAGDGYVNKVVGVSFMATQFYRIQEQMKVEFDFSMFQPFTGIAYPAGSYMNIPFDLTQLPHDFDGHAITKWSGARSTIESHVSFTGDANIVAELTGLGGAFGQWMYGNDGAPGGVGANADMMPKAPLPQDMFAWRTDAGNFGPDTDGDGYANVNGTGVNNLMALFTDNGTDNDLVNLFIAWKVYWGEDLDGGNITTAFLNMGDWQVNGANYMPQAQSEVEVWHKPLFPKGRFLLLKNPDSADDAAKNPATGQGLNEFDGMALQMGMPVAALKGSPDMAITGTGAPAAPAGKKVGVDWEWPLGPAASWGPFFYTDNNERFPLAFPWAPKGVAMENEMCVSCHDGAGGMSKQAATVWNPTENAYVTAYSHDSNVRGCARQQFLNADDDNNFGPHCANCHTGASGCQTCHSPQGDNWLSFGRRAYTSIPASAVLEAVSTYKGPASVRTSAANIGVKCLDGGFSYPHRTLGANMLKDKLWGVDFDGTPVAAGNNRTSNMAQNAAFASDLASFFGTPVNYATGSSFEASTVVNVNTPQVAENLDSVCIDCHGDASYWTGDEYKEDFVSGNPLDDPADGAQVWAIEGWNLLLKGLP